MICPLKSGRLSQTTITAAENKAREAYLRSVLQKIAAAKSFDELARLLQDSDVDANNEAVQTQISSTVQKLLGNEFTNIQNKASDYARAGKFSEARKLIESKCSSLLEDISSSVTGRGRSAIISQLNGYLSVWPDLREADTVSRVINYLNAIENGVRGYFTVVSGNFPNTGRSFDTPDVRVSVSGAVGFSIPLTENQERPSFGYGSSFTWRPNAGAIYIRAYEVDTFGSDLEILSVTINASGWDGINRLTGSHSNKGNSIYTRFDGSLPSCPW